MTFRQCIATTKRGKQCPNGTGSAARPWCHIHDPHGTYQQSKKTRSDPAPTPAREAVSHPSDRNGP